jgi:hypothetical protein
MVLRALLTVVAVAVALEVRQAQLRAVYMVAAAVVVQTPTQQERLADAVRLA